MNGEKKLRYEAGFIYLERRFTMFDPIADHQFTIDVTGRKKVILSVDGGGMRGAISIAMLAELETQTGKTCQQMFDLVAGTSTGAIIAVGLAMGMTANDILDSVYRRALPKAFLQANGLAGQIFSQFLHVLGVEESEFLTRLASHDLQYAYSLDPFLSELKPLVCNRKVSDLKLDKPKRPILFVTTKDILTGETAFIVNAGPGKDKFQHWPLSAVVATSGAAPVFFLPVMERFVDGGVGVYTNPCLAASIEAMEYIGKEGGFEDGKVIHVSLGTGYIDTKPTSEEIKNYNAIDWLRYVIMAGLGDGALQQVYATRAIYGEKSSKMPRMDFRRYNPLLSGDNVSRVLGIPLSNKPNPAELSLDSCGQEQVELMIDIGRAYARKLDWSAAHTLPWQTMGGQCDPAKVADIPTDWTGSPYAA